MDVPAHKIVATKQVSGEVFFELIMGGAGQSITVAQFSMPAADVTSLNTNVNGGATNATRTFEYAQKSAANIKGGHNNWRSNW